MNKKTVRKFKLFVIKVWQKMPLWLRVLTFPSIWIRNYPTNTEWDCELNNILRNKPKLDVSGFHTIFLNGMEVWISNFPYSSGNLRYRSDSDDMEKITKKILSGALPSRFTMLKLYDYLDQMGYSVLFSKMAIEINLEREKMLIKDLQKRIENNEKEIEMLSKEIFEKEKLIQNLYTSVVDDIAIS